MKLNPFLTASIMIIIACALIINYQSKEITKLTDKIEYQSVYINDISNNILKPLGIIEFQDFEKQKYENRSK